MASMVFYPSGGTGWTNSNNIVVEDGIDARTNIQNAYLLATMDLSALPDNAVINGLMIEAKVSCSARGATIFAEFYDGTSLVKSTSVTPSLSWKTFGGPTDLWGQASILASSLKNPSAKWRIKGSADRDSVIYRCDAYRVTVYYTESSTSQLSNPMLLAFTF